MERSFLMSRKNGQITDKTKALLQGIDLDDFGIYDNCYSAYGHILIYHKDSGIKFLANVPLNNSNDIYVVKLHNDKYFEILKSVNDVGKYKLKKFFIKNIDMVFNDESGFYFNVDLLNEFNDWWKNCRGDK